MLTALFVGVDLPVISAFENPTALEKWSAISVGILALVTRVLRFTRTGKSTSARVKSAPAEVRPAEVRPAEVRPAEVRLAEVLPAEVLPDEARHAEVWNSLGVGQAPGIPFPNAIPKEFQILSIRHDVQYHMKVSDNSLVKKGFRSD